MMKLGIKNFCRPVLLMAVVLFPCWVLAESFSLRPAKQEVVLNPGVSAQESFTITNNLGRNSYFELKLKNIELNRPGVYPLTDFVSLEGERVFVADGQTKTVYFGINIPTETAPGGAYGFLQVIPRPNQGAKGEAGVSAALGSTIFVRVGGPVKEEGKLVSFGILGRQLKFAAPLEWHFSFENSGNIYLNPYGKMILVNKLTGSQTLVDIPPRSVLPGQTRLSETKTSALGFPGLYSASLLLNRGYNDEVDMRETSFWFLPWPILLIFSAILLFFVWVIIFKIIRKKNV